MPSYMEQPVFHADVVGCRIKKLYGRLLVIQLLKNKDSLGNLEQVLTRRLNGHIYSLASHLCKTVTMLNNFSVKYADFYSLK
jgi:exopolysaccharide biosynthesis predicted pyruvyltransferase EpsI